MWEPIPPERDPEYRQHLAIADKIERDRSLLSIPLANIERWITSGISAQHKLREWEQLIRAAQTDGEALQRLLFILRDYSEESRYFRGFSPFAGTLSTEERREALRGCSYSH